MKRLIELCLIFFILISCKKEADDKPLIVERFNGNGYIIYDFNRIDIKSSIHILHEKIDKYKFSHFILAGSSLEVLGDFDYKKYSSKKEFIRIAFLADSFDIPDNVNKEFELDDTKTNIIQYFDSIQGCLISDTLISGRIKIYNDYSISNVTMYKISGETANNKKVSSECYILSYHTSYKLERTIKGRIEYSDSIFNLTKARINIINTNTKTFILSDFYYNDYFDLGITIKSDKSNLSGTYLYNDSNKSYLQFVFFKLDADREEWTSFNSGKVIITQQNTDYKIDFNLITNDNRELIGNWHGKIE